MFREVVTVALGNSRSLVQLREAEWQIRAVHRKAREKLGERVGRVRDALDGLDTLAEVALYSQHLRAKDAIGDTAFRAVDERAPRNGFLLVAQSRVERIENESPGGVDENAVDIGESVVAGRSRGGPGGRQLFVAFEDLLDENVRATGGGGQSIEITTGVSQSIRMIDAQAIGETLGHPAHDLEV